MKTGWMQGQGWVGGRRSEVRGLGLPRVNDFQAEGTRLWLVEALATCSDVSSRGRTGPVHLSCCQDRR